MRTPAPVLRGSAPLRATVVVAGCAVFGWGIAAMVASHAGLAPWDVLHQGLSARLGVSFGTAGVLVGVLVGALAWALGRPPGYATIVNMLTVGPWVDVFLAVDAVPDLRDAPLPAQIAQNIVGILVIGAGTALYVGAGRSAGPRDSLMLALAQRTGLRLALARNGIEVVALLLGLALGGTAGIGTLLFALGIGPAVEAAFRALNASPLVVATAGGE